MARLETHPRSLSLRSAGTNHVKFSYCESLSIRHPDELSTLDGARRSKMLVGPSTIPGGGKGGFAGKSGFRPFSFVELYSGRRFATDEEALQFDPDNVFEGPDEAALPYICGDRSYSYGPYINDPLDHTRVNCEIRYNRCLDRFEIWTLESAIEPYEELFLAYGGMFWYRHQHLVHIDDILYAYPEVLALFETEEDFGPPLK